MRKPSTSTWCSFHAVVSRCPACVISVSFSSLRKTITASRAKLARQLRCAALELLDLRQDLSAEQLDLLHDFLMAPPGLLEKQVHHPHAALVVERLHLLPNGVRPAHEAQPAGSASHVPLPPAGKDVAQVELFTRPGRLYGPRHSRPQRDAPGHWPGTLDTL